MFCTSILKLAVLTLLTAGTLLQATPAFSRPTPQCPKKTFSLDGGFYTLSLKNVFATVKTTDLITAINAIGDLGPKGIVVANKDQTRCAATVQIEQISPATPSGNHTVKFVVSASCSDHNDYQAVVLAEQELMRSMIEDLVQIPSLKVNPSWSAQPPCVGGGVTGSN